MPLPVALATVVACGSLVTSVKSSWELSRMVRTKLEAKETEEYSARVYRSLRRAFHCGIMNEAEYDRWYEKLLVATTEKDLPGLRKIRVHIRVLYDGAQGEKQIRQRSRISSSSNYGRHDDRKRRPSVRFDTRLQTAAPAAKPPRRSQDIEWPKSAGSIEYFPINEKGSEEGVRLARLQRQSSVTYPRRGSPETSSRANVQRSVSSPGHERGRSRRRAFETADDIDQVLEKLNEIKLEEGVKLT